MFERTQAHCSASEPQRQRLARRHELGERPELRQREAERLEGAFQPGLHGVEGPEDLGQRDERRFIHG